MSSIRSRARCVRCDNLRSARTRYVRSYRSAAAASAIDTSAEPSARCTVRRRCGFSAFGVRTARPSAHRSAPHSRARACAAGSAPRAVPHRLTREPCRVRDGAARPAQDAATARERRARLRRIRPCALPAQLREREPRARRVPAATPPTPATPRAARHACAAAAAARPGSPAGARASRAAARAVRAGVPCRARARSPTSRSARCAAAGSRVRPRRSASAHVGREVRDREIGFVPDAADDRQFARRDRARQRLVVERPDPRSSRHHDRPAARRPRGAFAVSTAATSFSAEPAPCTGAG